MNIIWQNYYNCFGVSLHKWDNIRKLFPVLPVYVLRSGCEVKVTRKVRNIMKYRKIALACLFSSLIINIFGMILNSILRGSIFEPAFLNTAANIVLIVGILLLITFITLTLTLWKCPCCKERLPFRFDKENDIDDIYVCPYCHTRFLDGEILE